MQGQSLGQEDSLEEGMATHSSILAWRIPRTEESGRLQPMGSQRVGHNRTLIGFNKNKQAIIHIMQNVKIVTFPKLPRFVSYDIPKIHCQIINL